MYKLSAVLLVVLFVFGASLQVYGAEGNREIRIWSDDSRLTLMNDKSQVPTYLVEYLVKDPAKAHGTILILPGGAYSILGMGEGEPMAKEFNKHNFNAYVLYYRHGNVLYPAPIEDAVRSIRIIRHNAASIGYNPNKIGVMGFSAGGHLAASCTFNVEGINGFNGDEIDKVSAKVNALILCYGVINTTDPKIGHLNSGNHLFGSEKITDLRKKYDFENVPVNEDTPPVFMWHTATDGGVPALGVMTLAQHLWKHKKVAELHLFSHGGHGVGLARKHQDIKIWPELVANFLKQNM